MTPRPTYRYNFKLLFPTDSYVQLNPAMVGASYTNQLTDVCADGFDYDVARAFCKTASNSSG